MKFSALNKCPFCEHEEFYTNDYVCATIVIEKLTIMDIERKSRDGKR